MTELSGAADRAYTEVRTGTSSNKPRNKLFEKRQVEERQWKRENELRKMMEKKQ
jgi:hypothetical protein